MTKQQWQQRLQYPAPAARNRTRWWWYGGAVEKAEICRELDHMQAAGLGGVELQVLYPLQPDDPENGVENCDYLSPQYLERVGFAAVEAHRRGMQFDLTLGSAWPFGGPFVPPALCAQSVLPYTLDIAGPCSFSLDLTTVIYGKVVGAVLGEMKNAEMLPETVQDVRGYLRETRLFDWPWGMEVRDLPVPAGPHKLVLFVETDRKLQVQKAMPGAAGPVMDHNRKDALRCFLRYAGDGVVQALGEGTVDNFFCDSIETEGHNWTDILYEAFARRRGYDLHPYIYALWGEVKGLTPLVRHDFHQTMGELTVENFFRELTAWCHEKHSLSRIQAHGTWGDILQAYGAADVPEGETFSAFDRYAVNTVHRRLASSAGHLYHKPVISNESFTWLRFPRFTVTPQQIKAAADSIFLDGINQIVNHGYSYSKADEGPDMLAFYASSDLNHTNPWWKYYPQLARYIQRVSDFLRQGQPVVTTAIYLPQHDIWAAAQLSDLHMSMKLARRLGDDCVDAIQKAGYWFDYVNDEALQNWQQYPYDTLLLIECQRIPLQTLQSIAAFAAAGGTVIAAGGLPALPCGLLGAKETAAALQSLGRQLLQNKRVRVTADKYDSLLGALRAAKRPDVIVGRHADVVGFVHRRTDSEELYYIANISPQDLSEQLCFTDAVGHAAVFDAMTGREMPVIQETPEAQGVGLTLELEAFASRCVVFSRENPAPPCQAPAGPAVRLLGLEKDWLLEVDRENVHVRYDTLTPWQEQPALRHFSGTGRYGKHFVLHQDDLRCMAGCQDVWLQLEHVGEVAAVSLNGQPLGVLLLRPWRLSLAAAVRDGLLREGENLLVIEVTNLLINRMLDPQLPQPPLAQGLLRHWPYTDQPLADIRAEKLFNWREKQMLSQPLDAGLWGDVALFGRT